MKKQKKRVNSLYKKTKGTLIAAGVIFAFSCLWACDTEDNFSESKVSPNITAGINTKATDTSWHEDDAIGIAMFSSGTDSVINEKVNCKYLTPQGDGLFTANGSDLILYPGDGSTVDFISYYPYTEEFEPFTLYADVSDQAELPLIDLMTSDRFEGASKNNPNVLLHFHHRLTKLVFNFMLEDQTGGASVESFYISGMFTQASYDMLANEFEIDDTSDAEIEVPVDLDSYDYPRATAIVLPREAGDGIVFHIRLDDEREYEVALVDDLDLETETMYIFNILLRDRETPPTISAAIIEEWKETDEIELETTPLVVAQEPGETTEFKANDKITVYDVYNNTELTTFTYDGSKYWTPSPEVYWENMGDGNSEKLTLRAEYTRAQALNDTQMPEVFIAEVEVERFGLVHFDFKIVPAKVVFELKSDDGTNNPAVSDAEFSSADLAGATIKLPGYITEYTLTNGVFTPGSSTGNINAEKVGTLWAALIVPQEKEGRVAIININGNDYVLDVTQAIDFEKGKVCKLTVNITKTQVPSFSASYTDWADGDTFNDLTALIITGDGETTDFATNDKMTLFYHNGTAVEELSVFTYNKSDDIWSGNPLIYWEDLEDMLIYNFYAVSTLTTASEGSNQMDDLMFADAVPDGTKKFDPIVLSFTKQTAKVTVRLTSKDGTFSTAELATAAVYLPNYLTGAKFVLNSYTAGTTPKDIQLSKVTNAIEWTGLIQAQTREQNSSLIKISVLNSDYYIRASSAAMVYDKAKAYTYTVDITKTGVQFTASYSSWDESGEAIEVETDLDK